MAAKNILVLRIAYIMYNVQYNYKSCLSFVPPAFCVMKRHISLFPVVFSIAFFARSSSKLLLTGSLKIRKKILIFRSRVGFIPSTTERIISLQ